MSEKKYRPSMRSLIGSIAYSLVPIYIIALVGYFRDWNFPTWLIVGASLGIMFSVWQVFCDLWVHFAQDIWVSEAEIGTRGQGRIVTRIPWREITWAMLRSRKNSMSRDDHLLIIQGNGHKITFITSVLPEADEQELLSFIRSKTSLIEQSDTGAI